MPRIGRFSTFATKPSFGAPTFALASGAGP